MTKKWFGPILQACGCCYEEPPPPPPPPCACDVNECLPIYADNFSRIRVQINIADELWSEGFTEALFCSTTCRNIISKILARRTWSGFSQFNGTYEIPFYAYNDETEVWEEADPTAVSCGVWFYPLLTADIEFEELAQQTISPVDFYGTYSDTGCATFQRQTNRTLRVGLETRTGEMYILDPVADYQSYGYFWLPLSNVLEPELDPPVPQRRTTVELFDCFSAADPTVVTKNVNATQPWIGTPIGALQSQPAGQDFQIDPIGFAAKPTQGAQLSWIDVKGAASLPLGIKFYTSQAVQPHRSGSYDSTIYPYGGPGIPLTSTQCEAQVERVLIETFATVTEYPQATGLQCNPFFPMFSSISLIDGPYTWQNWRFSNSAFSADFRVLLN